MESFMGKNSNFGTKNSSFSAFRYTKTFFAFWSDSNLHKGITGLQFGMLDFLGAKKIFHLQIEENLPLFTLFEALNWPLLVGMSRMNFHFDHFKKKELNYLFSGISKTHFSIVKTFFLLMELWVERLEGKHSTFLSHILVKCIVKPFSSKHSFLLKVVFLCLEYLFEEIDFVYSSIRMRFIFCSS